MKDLKMRPAQLIFLLLFTCASLISACEDPQATRENGDASPATLRDQAEISWDERGASSPLPLRDAALPPLIDAQVPTMIDQSPSVDRDGPSDRDGDGIDDTLDL